MVELNRRQMLGVTGAAALGALMPWKASAVQDDLPFLDFLNDQPPGLIAVIGRASSGKSTLAKELGRRVPAIIFDYDELWGPTKLDLLSDPLHIKTFLLARIRYGCCELSKKHAVVVLPTQRCMTFPNGNIIPFSTSHSWMRCCDVVMSIGFTKEPEKYGWGSVSLLYCSRDIFIVKNRWGDRSKHTVRVVYEPDDKIRLVQV